MPVINFSALGNVTAVFMSVSRPYAVCLPLEYTCVSLLKRSIADESWLYLIVMFWDHHANKMSLHCLFTLLWKKTLWKEEIPPGLCKRQAWAHTTSALNTQLFNNTKICSIVSRCVTAKQFLPNNPILISFRLILIFMGPKQSMNRNYFLNSK